MHARDDKSRWVLADTCYPLSIAMADAPQLPPTSGWGEGDCGRMLVDGLMQGSRLLPESVDRGNFQGLSESVARGA